jgi:probable F420-dependent oxidoreductase
MRFGYVIPNSWGLDSPRQVIELAERADELGVDSLWVSHHVLHRGWIAERLSGHLPYHDALTMLGPIATATTRARIGTSVLVLPYLHPMPTAKALATIDHLSEGRLDVGVGVGSLQVEHDAIAQVPYQRRGRYANEFLTVMQQLWTPGPSSFHGEFFSFENLEAYPGPFRPGGLPVYVGGHGDHATRRAARFGSGWHAMSRPPRESGLEVERVRRAFEAEGRSFDGCPFQQRLHIPIEEQDVSQWRRRFDAYEAAGVTEMVLAPQSGDVDAHRKWLDTMVPALTDS